MPTLDAAGLRDLITTLRTLDGQDRFLMSHYAAGIVNPDVAPIADCGTTLCAAGAKAAADGWRPQHESVYSAYNDGAETLVATGSLFVRDGQVRTAFAIARDALGLTAAQADFLFIDSDHITRVDDHITRVDDLAARVEHVIAHPDERWPVDSYPDENVRAERDHAADDQARISGIVDRTWLP